MEYYSYRLMVRSNLTPLHLNGRVFHQYAMDVYAKIEQNAPTELHQSKSDVSVDLCCGLSDAVTAGDGISNDCGRKVILPGLGQLLLNVIYYNSIISNFSPLQSLSQIHNRILSHFTITIT